jgi:hypothetical protein
MVKFKLTTTTEKKSKLLPLLLKHKKQNYKTSDCSVNLWQEEELKEMYEYLEKNKVRHEMAGQILRIYWREERNM